MVGTLERYHVPWDGLESRGGDVTEGEGRITRERKTNDGTYPEVEEDQALADPTEPGRIAYRLLFREVEELRSLLASATEFRFGDYYVEKGESRWCLEHIGGAHIGKFDTRDGAIETAKRLSACVTPSTHERQPK